MLLADPSPFLLTSVQLAAFAALADTVALMYACDRFFEIRAAGGPLLPLVGGHDAFVGRSIPELVGADDPAHVAVAAHFAATRLGRPGAYRITHRGHNWLVRLTPLPDASGRLVGAMGRATIVAASTAAPSTVAPAAPATPAPVCPELERLWHLLGRPAAPMVLETTAALPEAGLGAGEPVIVHPPQAAAPYLVALKALSASGVLRALEAGLLRLRSRPPGEAASSATPGATPRASPRPGVLWSEPTRRRMSGGHPMMPSALTADPSLAPLSAAGARPTLRIVRDH